MKQPSARKLKSPEIALRQAKRDAQDRQSEVSARSSKRLVDLMTLPAYQRLGKLNDADLEPAERDALRRSVRAALRPPLAQRLLSHGMFARLDNLLPTVGWRTMVAGGALLFALAHAVHQNAEAAVLVRGGEINLEMPNGSRSWITLPAGRNVAVTRRDQASAVIRVWQPRQGYAWTTLPRAELSFKH